MEGRQTPRRALLRRRLGRRAGAARPAMLCNAPIQVSARCARTVLPGTQEGIQPLAHALPVGFRTPRARACARPAAAAVRGSRFWALRTRAGRPARQFCTSPPLLPRPSDPGRRPRADRRRPLLRPCCSVAIAPLPTKAPRLAPCMPAHHCKRPHLQSGRGTPLELCACVSCALGPAVTAAGTGRACREQGRRPVAAAAQAPRRGTPAAPTRAGEAGQRALRRLQTVGCASRQLVRRPNAPWCSTPGARARGAQRGGACPGARPGRRAFVTVP